MKQLLLAVVTLCCVSVSAQTINVNQIRPSTTDGQIVSTVGGKTVWANGGSGGAAFPGSNGIVFNTSTTASRNATFSDIVPLWGSGSCSGFLKSDGTCSTPSGAAFPGTNGIVFNTSTTAARNATVSDIGTLLSPLYTSTNYGFGDSTLDGVGCDVYGNCFFGLLTAAHGGPSVNLGFGGQMASWTVVSMATNLNPGFITTTPQYSLLDDIGINDAGGCGGTNTLCQQNYSAEQNAAVAIGELTGTTYQTLAPACPLTGTWTSDTTSFAGGIYIGKTSTTNGDSMSCSITTTGNPIALEYVVHNGDAGTANCRVDSGSYQNINFFPYITLNNPVFTIFRSAEIAASAGTHTLNCIVTSATSASNPVEFIAVDSIPVGQTSTLPFFEMTNVISAGGTNDTASLDISNLVLPIVTAYQAEGANIVYADIRTPTNFPAMFSTSQAGCPTNTLNSSGGLHPNDCGHAAIAKAIMAAAPNIYQTNMGAKTQGIAQGPFQAWGQPITSMKNSSGQSGGNFSASFTTGINPGGWCVYANTCMLFANTGAQIVPGYSTNTPVLMLGAPGSPICFTGIPNTATLNSQLLPMRNCWSSNGDYYMYFPIGPSGTQVGSYFHPGFISRDNMISSSGSTPPSRGADVTFLGPYSGPFSISLGACKSAVTNPENPWLTFYRHGTDGNAITFLSSSGNGDNINGGSTGNSFVWNATEGDSLTFQCSSNAVGGSYWTASVSTTDASAISAGTLADARLSSNVPLLNLSNTFTGSFNTFAGNLTTFSQLSTASLTPATSSANVNSPQLLIVGNAWTGSASVEDQWILQDVLGTGTNPTTTLQFTHAGSGGPQAVVMPNVSTNQLTLSGLTGSTQCLEVNTSGVVSGTACTGGGFITSLTTTGTSGPAGVTSGVLNIPNYTYTLPNATTSVLGGVKPDGTTCTTTAGVLSCPGSGGISGLTTGYLPMATSATAIGNSHIDDGNTTASTITSTEPMVAPSFSTLGTTPGKFSLVAGTGSIPTLAANSAGFAGPVTGGTAYLYKLPATAVAGILHAAPPGTVDGVNESALTSSAVSLTAEVSGILPVANGGSGTASPGIVAGTNVTVSGTWPNQTINASGGSGIANTTTTVGTSAIGANTCTSASTVTMTGVTTAMVINFTAATDISAVTGWGSTGGLSVVAWPTSNTVNYKVCNATAASITPSSSVTFNVGAR